MAGRARFVSEEVSKRGAGPSQSGRKRRTEGPATAVRSARGRSPRPGARAGAAARRARTWREARGQRRRDCHGDVCVVKVRPLERRAGAVRAGGGTRQHDAAERPAPEAREQRRCGQGRAEKGRRADVADSVLTACGLQGAERPGNSSSLRPDCPPGLRRPRLERCAGSPGVTLTYTLSRPPAPPHVSAADPPHAALQPPDASGTAFAGSSAAADP